MHHLNFDNKSSASVRQNEIECEEFRLRKLLQENLIKVEKENYDLVLREMRGVDMIPEKQPADSTKHKKSAFKSLTNKKVKPLQFKNCTTSFSRKPLVPNVKVAEKAANQATCCGKSRNSQHSNIHFLNHFHSALISSKVRLQHQIWEARTKQPPCAIPLSPPCQKDVPFIVEKLQKPIKEVRKVTNTALYKAVSKEGNKQLIVQTLPSISIFKEGFKGGANVSVEEIREKDLQNRDFIKPPPQTKATSTSSLKLDPQNHLELYNSNQSIDEAPHIPKKSVSTETTNQFCDKDSLKSLIKEVLEDIQMPSSCQNCSKFNKRNTEIVNEVLKTSSEISSRGHICKCTFDPQSKYANQQAKEEKTCSFSQTDHHSENRTINNQLLKDTIREVLSEFRSFSISDFGNKDRFQESKHIEDSKKFDKEIQTNKLNAEKSVFSKEIQTSFQDEPILNYSETKPQSRILEENLEKLEQRNNSADFNTEAEMSFKNEVATLNQEEISKQLSLMTLKIENLMNTVNDHICKSSVEITERNAVNPHEHSILTRDVSLQFGPYLISRSVHTSPTRTTEKFSQCDILTLQEQEKQSAVDASTQSSVIENCESNILEDKSKVEVFTQYECPLIAVIDSCTQTEYVLPLQVSEHSSSTSVSSTPVNDNLFLDDNLSEGEIPWHLRFLTCHDKGSNFNSSNATESSHTSEEKDYSLSEGEIHPKYIQQWYEKFASEKRDDKNLYFKQSTSGHERSSNSDISLIEGVACAQDVLSIAQNSPNRIQHIQENPHSNLPNCSDQDKYKNNSSNYHLKNRSFSTKMLFPNNQNNPNEDMCAKNSKCTFAPFEQRRNHFEQQQKHGSKSEMYLKTHSPNNYSSLSSLECSSGEVLEESANILQSTLRESFNESM